MNLSLYEQETIINYNEADSTASVYTHNKTLIRKLDKLAQERPGDCHQEKTSHDGKAVDFTIPKSWVNVKPPRVASEAQKAASRAAAAKGRLSLANLPRGRK